jgi:hypothetical protein
MIPGKIEIGKLGRIATTVRGNIGRRAGACSLAAGASLAVPVVTSPSTLTGADRPQGPPALGPTYMFAIARASNAAQRGTLPFTFVFRTEWRTTWPTINRSEGRRTAHAP